MKVHDARDGFNDLKPEFLLGSNTPWLWIAAILLVVILFYRFRSKKNPKVVRAKKKLSEYLSELKGLCDKVNSGVEAPKALTAEVSLIVRRYLYDRTEVSVLESTPQEAEKQLEKSGRFSRNTSVEIAKLLLQLENISFSEQKSEIDSIQDKALQLIAQSQALLERIETRLMEGVI